MSWFDIDREGLAAILARRGKEFALFELISNSWDAAGSTHVEVTIEPVPGKPEARIQIIDDAPDGFANLAHAYTLFARSSRAGDAEKRGRFNLGEKLVLALCRRAEIRSTTGCVVFEGRERKASRRRTERGSIFEGFLRMTREEIGDAVQAVSRLIPPDGVTTYVNGRVIEPCRSVASGTVTLPTELADAEGNLRRTARQTDLVIYKRPGSMSAGWIYELGIPVVETGDYYDVDIRQKVPLNMDRDNVTPAYLAQVRALVLNFTRGVIPASELTSAWVTDATTREEVEPAAVEAVLTARFGDKRVAYDPSDPEANKRAAAAGYTVIPGGALPRETWDKVRAGRMALPAGKVTPTPSPFSDDPDAPAAEVMTLDQLPVGAVRIIEWAKLLGHKLLGKSIDVTVYRKFNAAAAYGNGSLSLNYTALGRRFFEHGITEAVNALLIHELAHDRVMDHLSDKFHEECCRLGAKLVQFVADEASAIIKESLR